MTGLDIDEAAIDLARDLYVTDGIGCPATFVCGDYGDQEFGTCAFDFITSVHTMEHVEDDRHFLTKCREWMADGGILVLEVPVLMRRPFVETDLPLNPYHVREYSKDGLSALVEEFFSVEASWGVSRGRYVEVEDARNAVMCVAQKRWE
jgi:cyclopropane fatty-acyl-phospholipid synthase-like methyltransferase